MHRRIVAALLVPSVVPLLVMVLVQPRAGAPQPTVTPSPVATWDIFSLKAEDAGQLPLGTATVTLTLSNLTPTAVAATPASSETLASAAEITALPTPVPSSTSTLMPPATVTPLSVAGALGSIVPFAQTSPATLAIVGAACLLAVGVLLLATLSRRQHRLPASPARPLNSSVAILEGVTIPNLKLYLDREQITVGRAPDCDFRIPENVHGIDAISRQHARFEKRGERWAVIDGVRDGELSTNGIYVNGKRTLENYLTDDDEITFGNLTFRFHTRPENESRVEGDPR